MVTFYDTRFGMGLTADEKERPGGVSANALTSQPCSLLRCAFADSATRESVIRFDDRITAEGATPVIAQVQEPHRARDSGETVEPSTAPKVQRATAVR